MASDARLPAWCRWLATGTEAACALLLLAIVLVNLAQVVFRYGLGAPLGWTEEVMRYVVIWLTFLGASAVLVRGEHMALDLAGEYGGPRARRAGALLALGATGAFGLLLAWKGLPFAERGLIQSSPSARIPMIVPYAAVVVGGALLLVQSVGLLVAEAGPRRAGDGAAP